MLLHEPFRAFFRRHASRHSAAAFQLHFRDYFAIEIRFLRFHFLPSYSYFAIYSFRHYCLIMMMPPRCRHFTLAAFAAEPLLLRCQPALPPRDYFAAAMMPPLHVADADYAAAAR